jgi:hypothetical protein
MVIPATKKRSAETEPAPRAPTKAQKKTAPSATLPQTGSVSQVAAFLLQEPERLKLVVFWEADT